MVREIVQVTVGECGNLIGHDFWRNISFEHNLDEYGNCNYYDHTRMEKMDTYFVEPATHSYKPRSIFVDLATETLDSLKASPICGMFKSDNFIYTNRPTASIWGNGYYVIGSDLKDEVMDCIRIEIEKCECLQGFQFIHSLGGGTGAGLGTLILLYCRDTYPDRFTSNYCIFPTKNMCNIDIAPYNVILSMHQLLENSDYTVIFDNQSLFNITQNILKQDEPKYCDLNWLISLAMNGVTAPLRYRGTYNDDLRKRSVNLIPFPRLHFFTVSHAPFFRHKEGIKSKLTVEEITDRIWSKNNILVDIDPKTGKYISSLCIYRRNLVDLELNYKIIEYFLRENNFNDKISMDIIKLFVKYYTYGNNKGTFPDYTEIFKNEQRSSNNFIPWIPHNTRESFIEIPPYNTSQSMTMLANTTAITSFLQRLCNEFNVLFNPRKMLHLYLNDVGMDEMEFQEAFVNVRDLITEYNDKHDALPFEYDYSYTEDEEEEEYYEDDDVDYNYNMDIVNQLIALGLGTEDDVKDAINNVVNRNDVNEIADYLCNQ